MNKLEKYPAGKIHDWGRRRCQNDSSISLNAQKCHFLRWGTEDGGRWRRSQLTFVPVKLKLLWVIQVEPSRRQVMCETGAQSTGLSQRDTVWKFHQLLVQVVLDSEHPLPKERYHFSCNGGFTEVQALVPSAGTLNNRWSETTSKWTRENEREADT